MKLQVTTACQGHGRCYSLAPQYLESDDEGFVTIRGGDPIELTRTEFNLLELFMRNPRQVLTRFVNATKEHHEHASSHA